MPKELLDIVSQHNRVIGRAPRDVMHRLGLPHRTVHVLVWHPHQPLLLLQKRALQKEGWPGDWDTSVGGHIDAGEDTLVAALRECREELGIQITPPDLVFTGLHRMFEEPLDRELVSNYDLLHEGPFSPDPAEVESVAWLGHADIDALVAQGKTTPHFALQWRQELSQRPRWNLP